MELICPKRHEHPERQEFPFEYGPYIGGWDLVSGEPNIREDGKYGADEVGATFEAVRPLFTAYNQTNFKGKIYIKDISIGFETTGFAFAVTFSIYKIDRATFSTETEVFSMTEADYFSGSSPEIYNTVIGISDLNTHAYFMRITAAGGSSSSFSFKNISLNILIKNEENLATIA